MRVTLPPDALVTNTCHTGSPSRSSMPRLLVNATCEPSGDHTGPKSWGGSPAGCGTRTRLSVPSARTVWMLARSESHVYAMREPSGDHLIQKTFEKHAESSDSCRSPVPSAFTTYIVHQLRGDRFDKKRMRAPSGDHSGAKFSPAADGICRTFEPSASMTYTRKPDTAGS